MGYMTVRLAGRSVVINPVRLRKLPDLRLGDITDSTWRVWRRRPSISYDDATAVAHGLTVPVTTAWESTTSTTLLADGKHVTGVLVTAATEQYFAIRSLTIERGRPFTAQEVQVGSPVAVIGWELADKLFQGVDPIGREVKLFALPYRVVGVVEKQGNLFGFSLDKFAVVPATSDL